MFFSRRHSNSHERHRRVIHLNWIHRAKAKWNRNANHLARLQVHRVFASRNVHAWQPSSTPELRLKIHAIEVRDPSEIDNKFRLTQLLFHLNLRNKQQQVLPLYRVLRRKPPKLIWYDLISRRQRLQRHRFTTMLHQAIRDRINRVRISRFH